MILTIQMKDRTNRLGSNWTDVGDGYAVMRGYGPMCITLCYIALPINHPDINADPDDLHDCPVNGGLTFGEGNVFGWDYGHAYNCSTPEKDIAEALAYFKARQSQKGTQNEQA